VVNNMSDHPMLLVNVAANHNHWLGVITVGTKSNRDGIGAQVTVFSGDHKWMHEVRSGSSYISSSDLRLHFGLGSASAIDRIAVRWPSGLREVFQFIGKEQSVDRFVTLVEGKGMPE
jgi:enediyne biosynthesis protein E4